MSIHERKMREKDERRALILNAALEIISEEGMDNLSIRKIASKIEYSPAIIYHYFKDKDDVINQMLKNEYNEILLTLSSDKILKMSPEERLIESIKKYINMALQMADKYKFIMLNNSKEVLDHTSILFHGASRERQALKMLCDCLEHIYHTSVSDKPEIELTAQIIWASTFGLIMRLITEKNTPCEQKERLINHHLKFITSALMNMN
ncbi:MAG: transcriptional regulator [Clostridiaceae bacterium]|jgi:AcrR family transcriptional regulator|nr:transcriptional regulator [Clostridiaceae bacterium]